MSLRSCIRTMIAETAEGCCVSSLDKFPAGFSGSCFEGVHSGKEKGDWVADMIMKFMQ